MAQVKLARGSNEAIMDPNRPTGADGKILIATDRYKIYTDITNPNTNNLERVELNQGIVILQGTIQFPAGEKEASLSLNKQLHTLDIAQDNFVIMVQGDTEEYYEQGVYCNSITAPNTLNFKRIDSSSDLLSNVSIFVYDGVKTRNFNITQENASNSNEPVIYPSGWKETDNGYTYSIAKSDITEDSLVMFGANNDVSSAAYITSGTTTDGALIVNASVKPVESIEIYIQQLPAGSQNNNLLLSPENWTQEDDLYLYRYNLDINTDENAILIQCLKNPEEFQGVTYEFPETGVIDFWSQNAPSESIELQIVSIPNEALSEREVTIPANEWTSISDNSRYYFQTINFDEALVCGGEAKDYSSVPIITCVSNERGYAAITKIEISENRKKLNCVANMLLTQDIKISIVDFLS